MLSFSQRIEAVSKGNDIPNPVTKLSRDLLPYPSIHTPTSFTKPLEKGSEKYQLTS